MLAYPQTGANWVATSDCKQTVSTFKLEMKKAAGYQTNEILKRAGAGKLNFEGWVNESHAIACVPGAQQRTEACTLGSCFHSLCDGRKERKQNLVQTTDIYFVYIYPVYHPYMHKKERESLSGAARKQILWLQLILSSDYLREPAIAV